MLVKIFLVKQLENADLPDSKHSMEKRQLC